MLARRDALRLLLALGLLPGCAHRQRRASYAERRAAHATALRLRGPSPGRWRERPPPAGAVEIRYPSEVGDLLAYFALPEGTHAPGSLPALVYFHGEFSLVPADFARVRPFVDAGFAVLTPSLRGENGNPGAFELLYGEVDDGVAALRWLCAQPAVDPTRIFALGHSVGGALSALLSAREDAPLAATASAGGIYVPETFVRWGRDPAQSELIRFDPADVDERELRSLLPHVADMVRPHVAYVGDDDRPIVRNAEVVAAAARAVGSPFTVDVVAGDHGSMIHPAVAAYRDVIVSGRWATAG
ncbi:MAG: CocE/NonD family hydrolase [Nannocystaceae bacterium]